VVLAGGRSRRMGQDKALLPLGDRPLITQIVDAALACTPEVWVMTPWPARYRSVLPTMVQFMPEVATAGDPPGPLVALAQVLTQIQTDWVLLLACDLPNVEGEVLRAWRDQLVTLPPATIAYLPQSGAGWEPLCGFYRVDCRAILATAIAQGTRSFQQWLATQTVVAIPQVPEDILLNCNTPADWKRYRAQFGYLQD
jgi:molybdopterin-guanine dinucleotide biosynthesis protein A